MFGVFLIIIFTGKLGNVTRLFKMMFNMGPEKLGEKIILIRPRFFKI